MGPHLTKKLPHSQEPNRMEREPCPAERVRLHGARTATRRAGAHPPGPVPGAFVLSNGRLKGPRGHGKGVTGGTGARASRAGGSGPSGGTRGGPAQAARAGREVRGLAPARASQGRRSPPPGGAGPRTGPPGLRGRRAGPLGREPPHRPRPSARRGSSPSAPLRPPPAADEREAGLETPSRRPPARGPRSPT